YNYHCVPLKGLKPDTKYYYQVKSVDHESEIYSFKTQPTLGAQGIYRFLIMGDHQILDDRYERLMKAAKDVAVEKYGSPIEDHIHLITNVGDQVDTGTLKQYDIVHFSGSELLSPNLPIMTIVGNHDTYGPADRRFYNEHFFYRDIEYQGIKSNSNYYYAMQQGRVLFLMLSSEDANNAQLIWANKVIQKAKKILLSIGYSATITDLFRLNNMLEIFPNGFGIKSCLY
ncbi:MAG: fibronectin type III domain-containing protein, partial [Bacteroidales bacterium]|nr:fibronectin type III domain-containing protein [Bacteroidales bacterium]